MLVTPIPYTVSIPDDIEHSDFAELNRDKFTLWIKIKCRFVGRVVPGSVQSEIKAWLDTNNIKNELSLYSRDQHRLRNSNQFFVGIFPVNESAMNAVKIVWGEYLTNRE